jgi:hypothetical protein
VRPGEGFAQGLLGFGGADGLVLLLNAGDGVEKELREVADGKGVQGHPSADDRSEDDRHPFSAYYVAPGFSPAVFFFAPPSGGPLPFRVPAP